MNHKLSRRAFLAGAATAAIGLSLPQTSRAGMLLSNKRKPNIVLIFCDDLGYGDIGPFGATNHATPHLDQMAAEGRKFTDFYVAPVCSPSRAALMTGCYPRRTHLESGDNHMKVFRPVAHKGLNPKEITIAEVLKSQGYATACIGKWHQGDQHQFLPTRQGFDYWFGLPYSNDMAAANSSYNFPPMPLMENETALEFEPDQRYLTQRYTEKAVEFIEAHADEPFFIYLPHTMPHTPLAVNPGFPSSASNDWGKVVEELDWSAGQILDKIRAKNLENETLVIFTSDNGAASGGGRSNLPLAGYKGSTMEGGVRVCFVAWWPGQIPAGSSCSEIAASIDLLPTFARLAGAKPPQGVLLDGQDIWPLMKGESGAKSPHEAFFYYSRYQLQAVRSGKWKLHLHLHPIQTQWDSLTPDGTGTVRPLKLVNLEEDLRETTDVSAGNPEVVVRLLKLAQKARRDIGDVFIDGDNQRPAGYEPNPVPLE